MIIPSKIAIALLAVVAPASGHHWLDPTTSCPADIRPGIASWVRGQYDKAQRYRKPRRERLSKLFAERVVLEARRQKLDPLALTAIAWIESDYRMQLGSGQGRRAGEIGMWQLIPWDNYVRDALRNNAGCEPSSKASAGWRSLWARRYKGRRCDDPDIGKARLKVGPWTKAELRDLRIGTYIAAYEVRRHIEASMKRRRTGLQKIQHVLRKKMRRLPSMRWSLLERYCHYNWGPRYRPTNPYRWKLFTRYAIVRAAVCP